jgi:CHRD domain
MHYTTIYRSRYTYNNLTYNKSLYGQERSRILHTLLYCHKITEHRNALIPTLLCYPMNNRRKAFLLTALLTVISLSAIATVTSTNNNNNYAIAQPSSQNQTTSPILPKRVHFAADLTGQGVPGPRPLQVQTDAAGKATFTVVGDGNTMSYVINVNNKTDTRNVLLSTSTGGRVNDVVQIHSIVRQGLPQNINGTLVMQGNITSANFVGLLNGQEMVDLVKMILDGNIFVKITSVANPVGQIGGRITPVL